IDDESGIASHQSLGPGKRPLGQRLTFDAVEQQVVERKPQLILLRLPPESAQEGRWKERDIEQGDDGEREEVEEEREARLDRSAGDADYHEQKKAGVAKAQRPQTPPLHRRPAPG